MTLPIRAILFDADGVIHRAPPFADRLFSAFGCPINAVDECISDIFAVERAALIGDGDYAVALKPILDKWAPGMSPIAFFEHWHTFGIDQRVLDLVQKLRHSGIYCALASNQERHRAKRMSEQLGYADAFDAEFYSCHVGHAKPSARFFEIILERTRLDPAATLFIDDLAENVAAAQSVGIHAIQFELPLSGSGATSLIGILENLGIPT